MEKSTDTHDACCIFERKNAQFSLPSSGSIYDRLAVANKKV